MCGGSGERLRLVERFTRADAKTLLYEFTVDDPASFTKPWTAMLPMAKTDDQIYEYACHEGELRDDRHPARRAGRRKK